MKEVCMAVPAMKVSRPSLALGVALGVAAVLGGMFALALGTAGAWRRM